MAQKWFYRHNTKTHGPFTTGEVKNLARAHALQADDLLWPEGGDSRLAVAAGSAIDFAHLEPVSIPAPDWVNSLAPPETRAGRPGPTVPSPTPVADRLTVPPPMPVPDWLADVGLGTDSHPPRPQARTRADQPSLAETVLLPEPVLPPVAPAPPAAEAKAVPPPMEIAPAKKQAPVTIAALAPRPAPVTVLQSQPLTQPPENPVVPKLEATPVPVPEEIAAKPQTPPQPSEKQPPAVIVAIPVQPPDATTAPITLPIAKAVPFQQGPAPLESAKPPLPQAMGFDPITGAILDPKLYAAWQKEQKMASALPQLSLQEAFEKARRQVEFWVDDEDNRPLIMAGDLKLFRGLPFLKQSLEPYQRYGGEFLALVWQHLEFMAENRKKYYLACSRET